MSKRENGDTRGRGRSRPWALRREPTRDTRRSEEPDAHAGSRESRSDVEL